jgi:glycosyltransferase A (GT-A) superfamily protein (DUF2064 family)
LNALGLGQADDARELVLKVRQLQPGAARDRLMQTLGAIAPDVHRRMTEALLEARLD